MKQKNKLTPFAKLVIVVIIFFGLRYLYNNYEELLPAKFFQKPVISEIEQDTTALDNPKYEDVKIEKDTISEEKNVEVAEKYQPKEDTVLFSLSLINDSIFTIQIFDNENKIILSDTLNSFDSVFVNLSEEKKTNVKILFSGLQKIKDSAKIIEPEINDSIIKTEK